MNDIEIIKEKIIEPFYEFPNPISIELKDTDVKLIENLINRVKELEDTLKCTQDSWYEDTKKIEEWKITLNDYKMHIKELEEIEEEHRKENGKLQEKIKELVEDNRHQWEERCKMAIELDNDVIPKTKIKEKLEELENFEPEEYAPLVIKEEQLNNVKWQIQVLQELLEE